MSGWIKTHRSLTKWEWYTAPNMVHLFIHLLINANYENSRWRGIELKRGQLITGRKKLSIDTGISERSVRTCIKRLINSNEITIKTTRRGSLVTICNYDKYQDGDRDSDQQEVQLNDQPSDQQATSQTTNERPTSDQQATTVKEVNKYKKEKKEEGFSTPPETLPTLANSGPILSIFHQEMFDKIWAIYPKQIEEVEAQWAFIQTKPNAAIMDEIIKGINLYRAHVWTDVTFIPKLSNFIGKGLFRENPLLNGGLGDEAEIKRDPAFDIQPGDRVAIDGEQHEIDENKRVVTEEGVIPTGMILSFLQSGRATRVSA